MRGCACRASDKRCERCAAKHKAQQASVRVDNGQATHRVALETACDHEQVGVWADGHHVPPHVRGHRAVRLGVVKSAGHRGEGIALAREAIASGAARAKLDQWVLTTRRLGSPPVSV